MAPILSLLTSIAATVAVVAAVNPLSVKEQEFVDSDGKRFVIVGVDYQPGGQEAFGKGADPLSDGKICLRDAALMQQLGINTIRSYNLDPTLNHDECASIFNEVGIYMILDVNSPLSGQYLDRSDPKGTYNKDYVEHVFTVIEAFKSYPNVLGFFSGNEVINDNNNAQNDPQYLRALQRDMKNYISAQSKRTIPVGYSAADVRDDSLLENTWSYFQCDNGDGGKSSSDFFGLNSYSWCGSGSSFQTAGYDVLVNLFTSSAIPVFFSEYGCNKVLPRVFDEVPTIYGPQMTTLSGGLVYEWTQEADEFGLVSIGSDGTLSISHDYVNLQGQYNKINVTLLESANSTATNIKAPKCDSSLIKGDVKFSTEFTLPDPPSGIEDVIKSGVSKAPTGSIVSVTQTSVQLKVLATDGSEVKGLKITPVQGANHPGNTGAAASATHSKGLAPKMDAGLTGGAVAAVVFGVGAYVL